MEFQKILLFLESNKTYLHNSCNCRSWIRQAISALDKVYGRELCAAALMTSLLYPRHLVVVVYLSLSQEIDMGTGQFIGKVVDLGVFKGRFRINFFLDGWIRVNSTRIYPDNISFILTFKSKEKVGGQTLDRVPAGSGCFFFPGFPDFSRICNRIGFFFKVGSESQSTPPDPQTLVGRKIAQQL